MNRLSALFLILLLTLSLLSACVMPFEVSPPSPTATSTLTVTPSPSITPSSTPTRSPTPLPGDMTQTFILSMDDNGFNHLFAYAPTRLSPTRLTNGLWDDISPAVNQTGDKVVFASNRNAYWDLYILNLVDGQISRLTDTPEFDGNPGWSPDDQWITYETMRGDQMDINILSITNSGQTFTLTDDPALDQDPIWSPRGREIAFVSNRSGNNEIWIANLDKPDVGRFVNLSQTPDKSETRPAWSPDGTRLAWAVQVTGEPDAISIWDSANPQQPPLQSGLGDYPIWSASGNEIATRLAGPNQDYLVAYFMDGSLSLPPSPINQIHGMDWHLERITGLPNVFYNQAFLSPTPSWQRDLQLVENLPDNRASVIKMLDIDAPQPYLHDSVNEAFQALRERIMLETGWDALASLEMAYTPLSASLDPGKGNDWLYTGRAFAINPLTLNAGWMMVMRENINGQTYWRIYLRTVAQDGSQGQPLRTLPWDLTTRYNLDPLGYDQGGSYAKSVPAGFWVDLTSMARKYGWERIPALDNWRAYFKGTQFNQFVLRDGLSWREAMLELYPPDIFITPTIVIPPTRTPTVTPKGYRYKTETPTITSTPTMRPTYTTAP